MCVVATSYTPFAIRSYPQRDTFHVSRIAGGEGASLTISQRIAKVGAPLSRMIHEGSSRKRADAKRDGHSEAGSPECILVQYVEGVNGETARHSSGSALAAEAS